MATGPTTATVGTEESADEAGLAAGGADLHPATEEAEGEVVATRTISDHANFAKVGASSATRKATSSVTVRSTVGLPA